MKTLYLGSYLRVIDSKQTLNIIITNVDDVNYTACTDTKVEYLIQFRKYNDLIVTYIVQNKNSSDTIFCHMSPSMKNAGFTKDDYQ